MFRKYVHTCMVCCIVTTAAMAQDSVVVPNINEEAAGPSNQGFPFNSGNMRYQQVYAADQFAGLRGTIHSFAYRVDEAFGAAFNSAPINTQIWFAHTDAVPTNLSTTFDDNMGNDATLVFDGALTLSSDGTGEFDIIADVEDAFVYNGTDNFIMEIVIRGIARTTPLDSAGFGVGQGGTDWTDRVWAFNPDAESGSSNGDDGMVTQFTLGGGDICIYTIKKSKGKKGCGSCPDKGDAFNTEAACEGVKDCKKKIKTTIGCSDGNGTCKIKAKRKACGF